MFGTGKHWESFDKLKEALTSAPILAYPNYSRKFILETDASLKGLGAVLTQEDDDGNFRVISYASRTLKPYERSMRNYSSAKLELLALKRAVCEKFKDYLIGSWFTILTDNNPLTYVHTSRLGASQIHWLSDLALFDFEIKYRAGKSNQAADALSQHPSNQNLPMMMKNGIPYLMVWFARFLTTIWILSNCPTISGMKCKPISRKSV